MDDEIAALQAEVNAKRAVLSGLAAPYRAAAGQDVQADASSRPVRETFDKFNALSAGERTMTMWSKSAGGRFGEIWTDCPWPFSGRLGLWLAPIDVPGSFLSVVYVHKLDYQGWSPASGPQFAMQSTLGFGHMFLFGGVDLCYVSFPVDLFSATAVGGTFSSAGNVELFPVANEGIGYRVRLTDPLVFVAWATDLWGFTIAAPILIKPELFSGKLPNIVGRQGEVQITKTGVVRKYSIDINFNRASYLDGGLSVSGAAVINWQPRISINP